MTRNSNKSVNTGISDYGGSPVCITSSSTVVMLAYPSLIYAWLPQAGSQALHNHLQDEPNYPQGVFGTLITAQLPWPTTQFMGQGPFHFTGIQHKVFGTARPAGGVSYSPAPAPRRRQVQSADQINKVNISFDYISDSRYKIHLT